MRSSYPLGRFICAVAFMSLLVAPAVAQSATTYTLDPASEVSIDGTSTRSDWTVYAEDIEGNFSVVSGNPSIQFSQAQFAVRASEISSRRSTIMDRLIDESLKVEEHPVIRFDLGSAEAGSAAGTYNVAGKLTLGGTTKDVAMKIEAKPADGDKLQVSGSHALKMSDYGLQAPVAMFGALRTGDEVTVNFNLLLTPAQ